MQIDVGAAKKPRQTGQTPKHKRPVRQKASDRMLVAQARIEEQQVHMALAPFDRAVREADQRWGIDCLPEIVSPETAAKYGSALGKLNEAIDAEDVEQVVKYVGVCCRGIEAMEREAVAAGKAPVTDDCIIVGCDDGRQWAILKDGRSWQRVRDRLPEGVGIVTGREAAIALAAYADRFSGMLEAIKQEFEGAEIVEARGKVEMFEDDIPF